MSSTILCHSTSGFFVSNGEECYFVFTNWHEHSDEQHEAIYGIDGLYFDFNGDGSYNVPGKNIHTFIGPFTGETTSSQEFYEFTDVINITDLPKSDPSALLTWKTEIEYWFNSEKGEEFEALLVWNPIGFFCDENVSFHATVAKMHACPERADVYIASVAKATKTTEPCNPGHVVLDLSSAELKKPLDEVPTLGQWGLISLSILLLIIATESMQEQTSPVLMKMH